MDLQSLPIDTRNPAVREYLSLIRLQVLTPLSLLINIASVLVCQIVLQPSIRGVAKLKPTSISPDDSMTAIYIMAIWLFQVGYCVMLVSARKIETKRACVQGVGFALVLANWLMAGWAISWVLQWFLLATILQGLLLLCLIYSNIVLLIYHRPVHSRPLDTALIHAPMRFFLILPLSVLFPYSLLVSLGKTYTPTTPEIPPDYEKYAWSGLGIVLSTNLIGSVVIITRKDILWCAAATWICVSLWSNRVRPATVNITDMVFTLLHPLELIASYIYTHFYERKQNKRTGQGPIALPADAAEGEAQDLSRAPNQQPSGEVDVEALWG